MNENEIRGRFSLIDGSGTTYDRCFHELWTASVGKVGYVKDSWKRLDNDLERARTRSALDSVLRDAHRLKRLVDGEK